MHLAAILVVELLRFFIARYVWADVTPCANASRSQQCVTVMQVPQYLLEAAVEVGQGAHCNIICTQPRRIAAISVAERVATEKGDSAPGTPGQYPPTPLPSPTLTLIYCPSYNPLVTSPLVLLDCLRSWKTKQSSINQIFLLAQKASTSQQALLLIFEHTCKSLAN